VGPKLLLHVRLLCYDSDVIGHHNASGCEL